MFFYTVIAIFIFAVFAFSAAILVHILAAFFTPCKYCCHPFPFSNVGTGLLADPPPPPFIIPPVLSCYRETLAWSGGTPPPRTVFDPFRVCRVHSQRRFRPMPLTGGQAWPIFYPAGGPIGSVKAFSVIFRHSTIVELARH